VAATPMRFMFGSDHRTLFANRRHRGAIAVVVADTLARTDGWPDGSAVGL